MSSPAVQLTFTLRTSPNVRTVHLLGSWDNYKNQLPLSALKGSDAKPGSWKGTFRFQGSQALKLGTRYWYYYTVDGYHVSHDPAKEYVVEPTTGRKLNVLDVPRGDGKAEREAPRHSAKTSEAKYTTKRDSRHGVDVPIGRALSPGKIQHPKPTKAYASRQIREADYDCSPVDQMEDLGDELSRMDLARHRAPSKYSSADSDSDLSGSSGAFSGSYDRSSPGSFTSVSSGGSCRCERYGVTRGGERVKLDCAGKVCGYHNGADSPSTGSDCSSETSSDDEDERERIRRAYEAAKAKNRHATNGVGTKKAIEEKSSRHAPAKSSGGRHRR